jgi:hypothetical protein
MKSELLPSGLPHAVCSQITADINDIVLTVLLMKNKTIAESCESVMVK